MGAEPTILDVGSASIPVTLRRSKRARRLTLRIAAGTGEARVTAPPRVSLGDIQAFLESQVSWLEARLDAMPAPIVVRPGISLPVGDGCVDLVAADVRRITREGDRLLIPAGRCGPGAAVRGWLKDQARTELSAACDRYAPLIGCRAARLTLRDPRSRWGSCTSAGALMFSWRLAMAPRRVLDYVALHEMAHLQEMNHSRDFWALVGAHMPDYGTPRDWLRAHGSALHRYRFG